MASTTNQEAQPPAPIAIVGMSCRLSGQVSTLDDFWTLMSRARSGWSEIPEDRFTKDAFWHPIPQKKGCFNNKGGYFMKRDLSAFDAPFFNITQQEAVGMDPQQRQLLECSYEALENAGFPKDTIAGGNMGVFIGGTSSDYRLGTMRDLDNVPMFDSTGNHQSILAGRISHYFDLRGPCFTLDTACSSGLIALSQAVQSIRAGESSSAIVAGCSLHLQPDDWISMSSLGIFNEHGKTYAFDHRAKSGFARGEGVGCLVLKPLDQAIKDNDKIRSIIVHAGSNQDGRTVGLSTPNGDSQEQLMRDVYRRACINTDEIGFVEAHGTGTKVGDPIEARAIYNVLGAGRTKRNPLFMGSAKTNVGHTENVSGIVSVIKATLMLEKGFILPNINFERANDAIPLDEWNMKVPTNLRPWPTKKKYIAINNFGFGGSNAHCVLQRPNLSITDMPVETNTDTSHKLFVISAHDEAAAKTLVDQLGVYVEQHPEVFQKRLIRDIAYTLGHRRSHMPWRLAIPAATCGELAIALNNADNRPLRASSKAPKLAFVFTGQGAQWHAMGRELIYSHPVFGETLAAADAVLARLGADFSLISELNKDKADSLVGMAHISQPACTAVQLALTDLLSSWGIKPQSVTGHSSGEIAAAYAAGAITLDGAMAVAYHRGQATLKMKARFPDLKGSMLAVGASPSDVRNMIKTMQLPDVGVACENSPGSTTASGDEASIDALAAELDRRSIFNRKLRVEVAYHSKHMELVADDYLQSIRDVEAVAGNDVAFFSSLHGEKLTKTENLDAQYWCDNLTNPVRFASSLHELCVNARPDVIVEIGPHAALGGPVKQILKGVGSQASGISYLSSLMRDQNATLTAVKLAGDLFMKGYPLDFTALNQPRSTPTKPVVVADFQPYPWTQHKYWFESRVSKQHRIKQFPRHDLLGLLTANCSDAEPVWSNVISTDDIPWLKDHKMQNLTTFPLTGYLCMVTEAASQRATKRGVNFNKFCFRDLQVSRPLILDDGERYETSVTLRQYAEGLKSYSDDWDEFRVSSWTPARGWLEHCRGLISVKKAVSGNPVVSADAQFAPYTFKDAEVECTRALHVPTFYSELESQGPGYGPMFQLNEESFMRTNNTLSVGMVTVPDSAATMPQGYETPSIAQTAFMDLFFQLTFAATGAGKGKMRSLYMPSAIKSLEVSSAIPNKAGEVIYGMARGDASHAGPIDFVLKAWANERTSEPLIKVEGFRMTPVKDEQHVDQTPRGMCYKLDWQDPDKIAEPETASKELEETASDTATSEVSQLDDNVTTPPGEIFKNIITIITDKTRDDPLVGALADLIDLRTGKNPLVSSFGGLDPSSEATYICLSEIDKPLLAGMDSGVFQKLQDLLLASSSILWVTKGAYRFAENPEQNLAQGLLRTLRSEAGKTAATLDLDPQSKLDPSSRAELILRTLKRTLEADPAMMVDFEYAEEDGSLVTPRIVESSDMNQIMHRETRPSAQYLQDFGQEDRRLKVVVGTTGALDSLYFKDDPETPLEADEVEVRVAATGMNFKDVVIAMGQVASSYLGVECAGTVARIGSNVNSVTVGDRVCAMVLGAYSTFARCKATSVAIIPDDMSYETAASVPVVYSTAYYGIFELARLEPGEKILIHAASGGVGQAAIQLAKRVGADIFATVGTAEKKKLLMDKYDIPENRIFYSRSAAFGPAIREATGGQGVDVVLNSLAGDLLRETWDCVAHFGRFIEIGKRDITSNTRLEMAQFEYNASFSSVDLTLLALERPKIMGRVLQSCMELLMKGEIKPIDPITVMGIADVESALRMLQSGKTSGKVVLSHRPKDQVMATHPSNKTPAFRSDASYIVIGGTGGLGRSMARWMVQQGARHIVLLSRGGIVTDELDYLINDSADDGASIYVKACDVADESSVAKIVQECQSEMPPIRGVIHAAMVLRDMLFEKMTFDDYEAVTRSKVLGARNFHQVFASEPLDFFIMLSSVAGIVGNRGQAAYAAANTYLDALARHRTQKGHLGSVAINLGAVEGVGYLAENKARQDQVLQNIGGSTLCEAEALALIDSAVRGSISASAGCQVVTGLDFSDGNNLPYYASDAKFAPLVKAALASTSNDSSNSASASLTIAQQLRAAPTPEEAVTIVTSGLAQKLCAILMLDEAETEEDVGKVMSNRSVTSYGLDSLNAIELRNWIGKELQAHLQVLELLTSGTLGNLAVLILKKSRIESCFVDNGKE